MTHLQKLAAISERNLPLTWGCEGRSSHGCAGKSRDDAGRSVPLPRGDESLRHGPLFFPPSRRAAG